MFCSVPRADPLQKGEKIPQGDSTVPPPTSNLAHVCVKCNAVDLLQKRSREHSALETASKHELVFNNIYF